MAKTDANKPGRTSRTGGAKGGHHKPRPRRDDPGDADAMAAARQAAEKAAARAEEAAEASEVAAEAARKAADAAADAALDAEDAEMSWTRRAMAQADRDVADSGRSGEIAMRQAQKATATAMAAAQAEVAKAMAAASHATGDPRLEREGREPWDHPRSKPR